MSSARAPGPAQLFPRSPRLCNIHFADVFPRRMCVSSRKNEKSPSLPASHHGSGKQPLATAPQYLFLSRRFQQGREPRPGIAGGCKQGAKCAVCWTSVEWSRSVLWRGASTGVKTGGLLASVWDRLPVTGVSTQCLREKNEVMRLHCLLTFRAEGGGVRSPSGLIVCARKRLFFSRLRK